MTEYYTFEGGSAGYVPAKAPIRWEKSTTSYDTEDCYLGSLLVACVVYSLGLNTGKPCYIINASASIRMGHHFVGKYSRNEYPTKEAAVMAFEEKFNEFWRGEL